MDYLIKKSDSSVVEVFHGGATKVQLPGMTGTDAIHAGGTPPKRPMDLGYYLLIKATEVNEPVDAATQKRGPTTEAVDVVAQTVTVTRTTVAKTAADMLAEWKSAMAESDRTMISREMESHLEKEHGGVTADTFLQKKYDDKKALRANNPK